MKRFLSLAVLGVSLVAATTAFAGEGYLTTSVYLRAGPDFGYPSVLRLRAGTPVDIVACVDDWSWCDVVTGPDRGWVAGNYLQEEYDGRRVVIRDYGVRIGIPIVSFVFGDYWDHYYRGRSWYGHRERWSHVQPRYYRSGSYGHQHGSYGLSGGSREHSGGYYSGSRDSTYRDSHRAGSRDTQTRHSSGYSSGSSGYRSGDGSRYSAPVTTQPSYQSSRAQSTHRSAPASTRQQAITEPRMSQSHANGASAQRSAGPSRSTSGQAHSAAGQQRAADAHQRNADRAQSRDGGRGKSDKHGDKGKDKDGNGH